MEKQIYLPAKLAEQLGFFKEQDLDVELINARAGVEAENELIAGEVQAVVGFYDHTIDIQSKGKSIISIVQLSRAPGEVELVATKHAKTLLSPADFKGRTLGITGIGSSTDFLTPAPVNPAAFSLAALERKALAAFQRVREADRAMIANAQILGASPLGN